MNLTELALGYEEMTKEYLETQIRSILEKHKLGYVSDTYQPETEIITCLLMESNDLSTERISDVVKDVFIYTHEHPNGHTFSNDQQKIINQIVQDIELTFNAWDY